MVNFFWFLIVIIIIEMLATKFLVFGVNVAFINKYIKKFADEIFVMFNYRGGFVDVTTP